MTTYFMKLGNYDNSKILCMQMTEATLKKTIQIQEAEIWNGKRQNRKHYTIIMKFSYSVISNSAFTTAEDVFDKSQFSNFHIDSLNSVA